MGINEIAFRQNLLLCLGSLMLFTACDPPREGCLDFDALSVDVSADEPCEDCCRYPAVNLNVIPARLDADTLLETLSRSSQFVRSGGDTVTLENLVFFLHDLELERTDGSRVPLVDTFGFRVNIDEPFEVLERSVIRVAPLRVASVRTGTLLGNQEFVALHAKFGLPPDLASASLDAQRLTGRFALLQDSLLYDFASSKFRSAYFKVIPQLAPAQTSFVINHAIVPLRFVFAETILFPRSNNLNLVLALPVEDLVDLPAGQISAVDFVLASLQKARIVQITTGR